MENSKRKLDLIDFIIINAPAFLFLLLVPAGIFFFFFFSGFLRYSVIPFLLWGISGCILLLNDFYIRKKELYLKLLYLNSNRDPMKYTTYLRSTICGLCLIWALKVHKY